MKKKLSILFVGCMLAFAACGDDADDTDNTPTPDPVYKVDLGGELAWHPVSAVYNAGVVTATTAAAGAEAGAAAALTWGVTGDVTWALIDPLEVLSGITPTPLATGSIDPNDCEPSAAYGSTCDWSATDVDITSVTLGLIMLIQDTRTTALFETTNMGTASGTSLAAWKDSGVGATDLTALVVSIESATKLSELIDGGTTTYADMKSYGYMFGMTVTSDLKPVGGVTVTPGDFTGVTHTMRYPNATLDGVGASTAIGLGFFLYAPDSATTVNTSWTACQKDSEGACDTDADYTWGDVAAAGTQPNTAFVLTYLANEACDNDKTSTPESAPTVGTCGS